MIDQCFDINDNFLDKKNIEKKKLRSYISYLEKPIPKVTVLHWHYCATCAF